MPHTLILLAHPEPSSFNGAWANASLTASQPDAELIDLCADAFDPVEHRRHYPDYSGKFDPYLAHRGHAAPPDVERHLAALEKADRLILHFPTWWFSVPAVLKGWCDRVLREGDTHSVAERFDTGKFRGKSVLFCVTTGAPEQKCGPDGREGDWRMWIWPLAQTFRYLGYTVKQPVAQHGVHSSVGGAARTELEARLDRTLAGHAAMLRDWNDLPDMPSNADSDFDGNGRLKPGAPSVTPFIRHLP